MRTKSLANGAMMIAIYLVFLILYMYGIFPIFSSLLLPIPIIIYSIMSQKLSEISLLFIGCCIGAFLLTSILGFLTTIIYGLSGVILGLGILKKWPYWNRIVNSALIYLIGFPLLIYVVTGTRMTDVLLEMLNESFTLVESMIPDLSRQVELTHNRMINVIPQVIPTLLLLVGVFLSFLSDAIAKVILKRLHYETPELGNIWNFQLGRPLAIAYLISQFMLAIITHPTINIILLNVLLLLDMLFIVQGIIVLITLLKKRIGGLGIGIALSLLLLTMPLFLPLIGIMDALFNYRNRINKEKS